MIIKLNKISNNNSKFMYIGHKFLIDEKYDITKIIGHGAYGVVASGNDTKKNVKVAIKKVK